MRQNKSLSLNNHQHNVEYKNTKTEIQLRKIQATIGVLVETNVYMIVQRNLC